MPTSIDLSNVVELRSLSDIVETLNDSARGIVEIRLLIASYSESWNQDRLYEEADDLLQRYGYDNSLAAAALLGRDARAIAQPATLDHMTMILENEVSNDTLALPADMGLRSEENLALLEALLFGIRTPASRGGND